MIYLDQEHIDRVCNALDKAIEATEHLIQYREEEGKTINLVYEQNIRTFNHLIMELQEAL